MKKTNQPKNHFSIKLFLILVGFLSIILIASGITIYKYYKTTFFDSSTNGNEAIEINQNTIPKDVEVNLNNKNRVLGTNSQTKLLPASVHVPILMYHYVEYVQDPNDKIRISLNTTPYTLEQEIKTLSDAGYTFMTNQDLNNVLDGKAKLPPKPVLLTFDDGYRDFYTDAYPILKKYHAKATEYVISGFLNWQNHLTVSQLKEIANDGLVEIGAHTVHHIWLKGQSLQKVEYEVAQSKKTIEDIINKPVVSFAYPYGAFDLQALKTVAKDGFDSAVSTIPGIDQLNTNRYFLYRLRPDGLTGKYLLSWLSNVKNLKN